MRLYNFLTRKKEDFTPLRRGVVGLYTCGPTVYNYAHIGNLRTYIFEDVLRRALEFGGYRVKHIMNITDVDDKTIRESCAASLPLRAFTARYEKAFYADLKQLNILPASKFTRATAHIPDMIKLISILLKNGAAYRADDGVYFSLAKFKHYGKLSLLALRKLKSGARVRVDEYDKKLAEDFALWKFKKSGEPSWQAPFGEGRPGWHIECSAMAIKYLGSTFDIHTGAVDLIFPHHENEIAQSEAATGKPFAKYFLEGEHLLVEGKKMSKSLGNFYVLNDLTARGFDPLDFRYLVLTAHYRQMLNFTWRGLEAARAARLNLQSSIEKILSAPPRRRGAGENLKPAPQKIFRGASAELRTVVFDDLNAPQAIAALNRLLANVNKSARTKPLTAEAIKAFKSLIAEFDSILGLKLPAKRKSAPAEILRLAKLREAARKSRRWAEADRLREAIKSKGFDIEDSASGPQIKKHPK